jgi:RNA polymerase sigma factor (sigma-70 family)
MSDERENGPLERGTLMGAETPTTTRHIAEAVLLDASKRAKLLAFAGSRFGIGAADAEDILQDTLLELLRKRVHVRSPEGFVFTIFRACCARHVQASRASRQTFGGDASLMGAEPHPQGPETLRRQVALRQALEGISSACRRLLCAFYIEGRSLRDTADTFAVPHPGVSKTINRCLRRLRQCLN